MEIYTIQGDGKKPDINLNGQSGKLEISGRSIPEHAGKFYIPILDWITDYLKNPAAETEIRYELEYYNSSSKRYLLDILEQFNDLAESGKKVTFDWIYEEDDEDAEDVGALFCELIKYPGNLIAVPEEE